ncbi:MAG TPA: hypothetical protein VM689_20135 [Aliidongia sp.]|nr:hypothetical protein [Aliidongia sp.]
MQPRALLRDVTYEIHRRSEAGWEITGVQYDARAAIFEAQRVFNEIAGTLAVRVFRDVYDPATNTSRVNTVFRAVLPVPEDAAELYRKRRQARRGGGRDSEGPQLADELMGGLLGKILPDPVATWLIPHPQITRGLVVTLLGSFGLVLGTAAGIMIVH